MVRAHLPDTHRSRSYDCLADFMGFRVLLRVCLRLLTVPQLNVKDMPGVLFGFVPPAIWGVNSPMLSTLPCRRPQKARHRAVIALITAFASSSKPPV